MMSVRRLGGWLFGAGLAAGLTAAAASQPLLRHLPPPLGVGEFYGVDPTSGLALGGFDPTLYLLEGQPGLGDAAHELIQDGIAWRFRTAANKAAFLRDPDAFLPRLGAYDADGVARGLLVRADPLIWVRDADRIYLFRNPEARHRFESRPHAADAAEGRWPALQAGLVRD